MIGAAGLIAARPAIGGGSTAGGSAAGVTPLAGSAALSKHAAEHATTTKGKATHKRARAVRGIMLTIIRPFPGVTRRSSRCKESGRFSMNLDGPQKAQARRQEGGPALLLESKQAFRPRRIGRSHGSLGFPVPGWPVRVSAAAVQDVQENNVDKAFFLELFLERVVILTASC